MLFRTHVDIYRNHLGGLMLIKPVSEKGYRVLFMTELGIKIFDMEFLSSGDFKLHYCLDALNRKSVLETLKNDISLIINPVPEDNRIKIMRDRRTGNPVIKYREKQSVKYYFVETNHRVNRIKQKNGCIKRANMNIYSSDSTSIDSIRIAHSPVKLNIYLSTIHENQSEVSE
jgi:beta-mannanase